MSVSDLSLSTQNYLKVVWGLTEWSDAPVTPSRIAERTGLRMSSVSDAVRKLTAQGLLDHSPYGAVHLTDQGRVYAVAMIRRHRLLEAFLVSTLGYSWDQVHDEAENLEHAVSDFMIDRIDALLGHPDTDPHGDPIPSADGTVRPPAAHQLTAACIGQTVTVTRISDADSDLLKFFEANGIVVGARITVSDGPPYSESLQVAVGGEDADSASVTLGRPATDALYVDHPR